MPSRIFLTVALVPVLAMMVDGGTARADVATLDTDASYSATRIIEGGGQRMEQRYFQRNGTTNRMEMMVNGQPSTIIMHGERGVMWILMPAQRMYMESPIREQPFDGTNVEIPDPASWEMEREGRESVNGVPATRYRVATDSGETTRMRGHLWISDHGIPLRTDMVTGGDRIQMELRDLVVGPQPAELFHPPAGYQRIALGGGMPGGSGGTTSGAAGLPGLGAGSAAIPSAQGVDEGSGFAGELAAGVAEEARQATRDEVRATVSDSVRKGLRGILNRK